jgi:aspartyl-tRNA(Asn)/glutamyl-tRNA(Gln) amidotransferase subunit A
MVPLAWSLDHVGPMARTVRDCALILGVIAGFDPGDPTSADVPVADYLAGLEDGAHGLRVGLPPHAFFEGCSAAVQVAVEEAARLLGREGADLRVVDLGDLDLAGSAGSTVMLTEASAYHQRWLRERPQDHGEDVRLRLLTGALYPATAYVNAQRLLGQLRVAFLETLAGVDVVLLPSMPITAPSIAGFAMDTRAPLARFTMPLNLVGLPALALPCGVDAQGLPIGMQLVGRPFEEATVLRAGRAYERATDWHRRRPVVANAGAGEAARGRYPA